MEFDWTGKDILIVEDDKFIAYLFENYLKKSNACIAIAPNAEIGVQKALSIKPNIIIMDIKLPGMSGLEATKIIRQSMPNVPIIAQSAFVSEADVNSAKLAGCTEFLPKPVLGDVLLRTISKYI